MTDKQQGLHEKFLSEGVPTHSVLLKELHEYHKTFFVQFEN